MDPKLQEQLAERKAYHVAKAEAKAAREEANRVPYKYVPPPKPKVPQKRGRKPQFKEGKRLYAKITEAVLKGITYKKNVAAHLGMTHIQWQRMAEKPESKLNETYEEALAHRNAMVQIMYGEMMSDPNISTRIRADFVKTEKLMIDKRQMDEDTPATNALNPGLYLTNEELMMALAKPALRVTLQQEPIEAEYSQGEQDGADNV